MLENVGNFDTELGVNLLVEVFDAANTLDLIEINEAAAGNLNRLRFIHSEFFFVDNELDFIGITECYRKPFRPAVGEDVASDSREELDTDCYRQTAG